MTLRITRVRDVNGVIWHIRNGTISKSGNESHGWARAVVDIPLPYSLDITEARPLMEEAAVAMWHDDAWSEVILERPEVWGVQQVTSDAVLMRVIARTAPLRQWEVGARAARADDGGAVRPGRRGFDQRADRGHRDRHGGRARRRPGRLRLGAGRGRGGQWAGRVWLAGRVRRAGRLGRSRRAGRLGRRRRNVTWSPIWMTLRQ